MASRTDVRPITATRQKPDDGSTIGGTSYDSGAPAGAEVRGAMENVNDKATRALTSDTAQQTPLLTNVGKESYDLGAGTARGIAGTFSGDWDQAKAGFKQAGSSVLSALTLGSLRTMNNPPPRQYMGGSAEALEANRAQYDAGMLAGADMTGRGEGVAMYGAGTAAGAADMGRGAYDAGMGLYGQGSTIGQIGMARQDASLGASVDAAGRNVGSLAAMQQRQATDAQNAALMAQAASARGGNAAAAMRNAQDRVSQNNAAMNQQLGLMRLKEDQDRQIRLAEANRAAAGMYGDRASMGYGTAAQGLGAANTATGQVNTAGSTIGGIGGDIMSTGTANTKTFVDAEVEQNKAQLDADTKHASAKQASKGGVMGVVGKAIGGLFALAVAFMPIVMGLI